MAEGESQTWLVYTLSGALIFMILLFILVGIIFLKKYRSFMHAIQALQGNKLFQNVTAQMEPSVKKKESEEQKKDGSRKLWKGQEKNQKNH